jgi:hemin uptake protein HemP
MTAAEPHPDAEDHRPAPPDRTPVLSSADLLRGGREVTILHAGEAYRLRVTSKDRLILTK